MNRFTFILIFFFASAVFAQYAPQSIQLSQSGALDEAPPEPRLGSNVIIDILPSIATPGLIWLGTGGGVTLYDPREDNNPLNDFRTWGEAQGLGKGGVSGLLVTDSIIWASFAFDTSVGVSGAGGGLAYSRDQGLSWTWLPQPRDRMYDTDASGFDRVLGYWPTTTNVDNITYDIAMSAQAVWIVSKGGGIRRHVFAEDYTDYNDTTGWRCVDTLHLQDGRELPFHPGDPVEGLYHRAFSVIYDSSEGALWIGTAAGALKSTDEGQTWKSYSASGAPGTLSGNFVTALDYQPYDSSVWAASWRAENPLERYAVSKTTNGGQTWRVFLDSAQVVQAIGRYEVVRAHSFAFDGPIVYVCDDLGLWKSPDNGATWDLLTEDRIFEAGTERRFYYDGIYSALAESERLWVGGVDGLAFTDNGGISWIVLQTALPLDSPERPTHTYAYPNPFSPQRYTWVKFRYYTTGGTIKITLYDFAMSKVVELPAVTRPAGEHYEVWNGKKDGEIVANGTYFYKIEKPGGDVWGKVIVLD